MKNNNNYILLFLQNKRFFKSWLSFFSILVVASSLPSHVFAITADDDTTDNQVIKNPVIKSITKVPSPRKQMSMGVPPLAVICNAGLRLVLKASDGFPACVRPSSIDSLVERGWAQSQAWEDHD